jgi:hypothetical protein
MASLAVSHQGLALSQLLSHQVGACDACVSHHMICHLTHHMTSLMIHHMTDHLTFGLRKRKAKYMQSKIKKSEKCSIG